MKRAFVLIALATCACERPEQQSAAVPAPEPAEEMLPSQGPTSKPAAVVSMPKEQAELDRMILAGYTPHGSHLHPPGMQECPLAQGTETVM
jgi:hypothetical protein